MAKTLTRKPGAFFRANGQVRKLFDELDLRALGRSVKKQQIHPLIARMDGTLLDGERRWRGGTMEGVLEFDCILTDEALTSAQITELQLVSSLQRSGLSDHELAVGFQKWMTENAGATGKSLAERVDKDPATISRYLSLWKCGKATQEAAAGGKLNVSDWTAISKAENPEQEAQLLQLALAGATRQELEKKARKPRNGQPAVRVSRVRFPIGGAVVTVQAEDASLEDIIGTLTELLKAAKKANDESIDVKTFARVCADRASA